MRNQALPTERDAHTCTGITKCVTHGLQLLIAGAKPLPLAGDDGEQRVHLTLRKLRMRTYTRAWK